MGDNFIVWNENYATRIPLIDIQNKTLVRKINKLYSVCEETKTINQHFFQATNKAVNHLSFHFKIEENLMYMLEYSDRIDHKKEMIQVRKPKELPASVSLSQKVEGALDGKFGRS